MLYQDRLGMLYEVPDGQVYGLGYVGSPYGIGESQVLYDGLGNPVGAWPFSNIAKSIGGLVSKALPAVSSFIPGGGLLTQALPALAQGMAPSVPTPAGPVPVPTPQVPPTVPQGMMPGSPGVPMPMVRPLPLGWMRPQLPYTGLGPRRLYMRCAVWPGPAGLVPEIAAQAPAVPAQAAAAAAAQTAAAMIGRRRHRGHRR